MASVFWNRNDILLVNFMAKEATINAVEYCETLEEMKQKNQRQKKRNADSWRVTPSWSRQTQYCPDYSFG